MDVTGTQLGGQTVTFAIEQQQRVIAGRLEVSIVGALLLLAINPDLGAIHVEHHAPRWIDGFRPHDQLTIERRQTGEVVGLRQQFRLEGL